MDDLGHDGLRRSQELEVTASHMLTEAEYALGFEAYVIGRVFAHAGIEFDPYTFVSLRIIEASLGSTADPVDALVGLTDLGTVDRAVGLATNMLAEGA